MKSLPPILLLILFAFSTVTATWQYPDILIHKGTEFPIYEELLGPYFKEFPQRKPTTAGRCSALWRGYVATFEILNHRIEGCDNG